MLDTGMRVTASAEREAEYWMLASGYGHCEQTEAAT
jgi:hypothetical protein